jgi:phosphohistidine phosphatase SixA
MYVGHNPAAADVTEILIGDPVDFPTSAVAIVSLDAGWSDLAEEAEGAGQLAALWTPRSES